MVQKITDEKLKGRGLTKYRRLILEVLSENPHIDAYEIHRLALKKDPKISLPTVYRSLRYLKEQGYIAEHRFNEKHSHYEILTKDRSKKEEVFVHLICEECGRIEDAGSIRVKKVFEVAAESGYSASDLHLNVFGKCPSCREKDSKTL